MIAAGHIDAKALAGQLRKASVSNAESLAALAEVSWRISTTRTSLAELRPGQSRFGGSPDVPVEFVWPTRGGRPLTFLAQLDLSQVRSPRLPEAGWLLFFYDVSGQPWGFDPADASGALVAYVDTAPELLVRREHPAVDDNAGPFEPCSLSIAPTVDLPPEWDSIIDGAGLEIPQDQWEAYSAVAAAASGVAEGALYHHLLGHPQLVQNDMRRECELVTNGIYCGDPSARLGERAKQLLLRDPADWQLLLQIDTDERGPGWMWGDSGRIYFWMRRSDLATRAFENAWLVLQCG